MIKNATIPTLIEPRGLDIALNEINTALVTRLTWINTAYGKTEIIRKVIDNREVLFPGLYVGGALKNNYISLLPDQQKGTFSYWDFEDGQDIQDIPPGEVFVISSFKLVLWFDYRDLWINDTERYSIENVKAQINEFFRTTRFINSIIRLNSFLERPENIYAGYDYREADNQFQMRPFGALAVTGRIKYPERAKCFDNQPTINAWVTASGSAWVLP